MCFLFEEHDINSNLHFKISYIERYENLRCKTYNIKRNIIRNIFMQLWLFGRLSEIKIHQQDTSLIQLT